MKDTIKTIIGYAKGVLEDANGVPSSKRIISIVFAILLGVAFCANLFYDYAIDDNILDAIMLIVIAGLGISGVEKFAPKSIRKQEAE